MLGLSSALKAGFKPEKKKAIKSIVLNKFLS